MLDTLGNGPVKGDDDLEGRPAILDLPGGRGRVLAYNFNLIHRDLNRSDYRFLWNALLNMINRFFVNPTGCDGFVTGFPILWNR